MRNNEILDYNKKKEDMKKQGHKINDLAVVCPIVPLTEAIDRWTELEMADDFQVKRNQSKITIRRTHRVFIFLNYLLIQFKKKYIGV
ncbi:unnamed protein product [Rotaria sordida]|uniref:Uncharacterized protein n=1 Tax=Rotaria sordida TaxID=392033 RepID=A0A818YSA6_9BILA|nr:unnamed protein product [Rotaria sordida]